MILACQNISKSFGVEPVIRNVSFHVEDQEKVAIVGINGAGKSTLLKIIVGELPADEGTVTLAKGKTLGYLAQHQDMDDARTIYETVLEGKRQLIDMEQKIRELEEGMLYQKKRWNLIWRATISCCMSLKPGMVIHIAVRFPVC